MCPRSSSFLVDVGDHCPCLCTAPASDRILKAGFWISVSFIVKCDPPQSAPIKKLPPHPLKRSHAASMEDVVLGLEGHGQPACQLSSLSYVDFRSGVLLQALCKVLASHSSEALPTPLAPRLEARLSRKGGGILAPTRHIRASWACLATSQNDGDFGSCLLSAVLEGKSTRVAVDSGYVHAEPFMASRHTPRGPDPLHPDKDGNSHEGVSFSRASRAWVLGGFKGTRGKATI